MLEKLIVGIYVTDEGLIIDTEEIRRFIVKRAGRVLSEDAIKTGVAAFLEHVGIDVPGMDAWEHYGECPAELRAKLDAAPPASKATLEGL